jgi:hypothetical protein
LRFGFAQGFDVPREAMQFQQLRCDRDGGGRKSKPLPLKIGEPIAAPASTRCCWTELPANDSYCHPAIPTQDSSEACGQRGVRGRETCAQCETDFKASLGSMLCRRSLVSLRRSRRIGNPQQAGRFRAEAAKSVLSVSCCPSAFAKIVLTSGVATMAESHGSL